jgi:Sigma-70 region 2
MYFARARPIARMQPRRRPRDSNVAHVMQTRDNSSEFVSRLSRAHGVQLLRFLERMLGRKDGAEDVAQEAYLKLYRLSRPDEVICPRALLFDVATKRALLRAPMPNAFSRDYRRTRRRSAPGWRSGATSGSCANRNRDGRMRPRPRREIGGSNPCSRISVSRSVCGCVSQHFRRGARHFISPHLETGRLGHACIPEATVTAELPKMMLLGYSSLEFLCP